MRLTPEDEAGGPYVIGTSGINKMEKKEAKHNDHPTIARGLKDENNLLAVVVVIAVDVGKEVASMSSFDVSNSISGDK